MHNLAWGLMRHNLNQNKNKSWRVIKSTYNIFQFKGLNYNISIKIKIIYIEKTWLLTVNSIKNNHIKEMLYLALNAWAFMPCFKILLKVPIRLFFTAWISAQSRSKYSTWSTDGWSLSLKLTGSESQSVRKNVTDFFFLGFSPPRSELAPARFGSESWRRRSTASFEYTGA